MVLEPGRLVRVRSRQYLVEEVTPAPALSEQTLVRLSCIDDDSQGAPLEVRSSRLISPVCRLSRLS